MTANTETETVMTKADLLTAMDDHEQEGLRLDAAMETLGLTPKDVKAMRKAQKAADEAKKTLDALMGVDPATAEKVVEK